LKYIALLVLSLVLAAPVAASAQAAKLSDQDTQLLQDAAVTGAFEIQASQIALQSATQESVKEFARLMLLEHELISADLANLAKTKNVALPTDLDNDRREDLGALQQLKGPNFDKRYIEEVAVGAHEEALERFNQAYKQSSDEEIKAFAAKTVKRLQQHLDRANNIARARDGDTAPAEKPGSEKGLPKGEATPETGEPTREGAPGTPERAAESQ
jgi:putative membrane protein